MNNQQLSKIEIGKSGYNRSRFNFSRDVNTTADFGSTQPLQCKMLIPGSKSVVSTKSLTRLAPMVAPAFGRVKFKLWHEFVPCKDVCDYFDALMAQQNYYCSGSNTTKMFSTITSIPLNILSWFVLIGARATIYARDTGENYVAPVVTHSGSSYTGDSAVAPAEGVLEAASNPIYTPLAWDSFSTDTSTHLVLQSSFFHGAVGNGFTAPSGNRTLVVNNTQHYYDLMRIVDSQGNAENEVITPEGADIIYDWKDSSTSRIWALCFRLSSFGKRLRKILIGLGYQLDLVSSTPVSLLPVFAYYKAYWNIFGLTQWQLWENTSLYVFMKYLADYGVEMIDTSFYNTSAKRKLVVDFINDLGSCFVTDNVDFVSAHLPSTAVSPSTPNMAFVDVNVNVVTQVDSQGSAAGQPYASINGHSFISQLNHGELDSDYLKRLYKWTNKNTIVGRRIAEVLRSQGLGKYVDGCTTDFIGYTEDEITISDVVSNADTSFAGAQGARLGQYGGKGVQYTEGKTFTYENDQFGYWITIASIVPETGYMRQFDPTLFARDKFALYNPDFDSMGFEAHTKRIIVGGSDWNRKDAPTGDNLDATYGYCPRYFGFKFATNINNGDMSLRGTRNNYLPYTLDKLIPVNEARVFSIPVGYKCIQEFTPSSLPIADERIYRPIGKYPWMAHYDRIFAEDDSSVVKPWDQFAYGTITSALESFCMNGYDNFLIHNIVNFVCYAPMLPVEESFETTDDDDKSTMSVQKA